ncbi:hypothetical protein M378DRAFT_165992 [Amanita muscaria Koide BX008]|uniref:Uncharacterized protein n=1 Tax=Amanita muscaria (strain Koide BX008) TaxID=946122 RepID=A0A0C2X0E6_AMAMK|nr:hypothetical protein M378DRAFT_165992 [Amanita muscaria Koide BX008]
MSFKASSWGSILASKPESTTTKAEIDGDPMKEMVHRKQEYAPYNPVCTTPVHYFYPSTSASNSLSCPGRGR